MQTLALKTPVPTRRPSALPVRAKLKLGATQDEAEKQADRMAALALGKAAPAGGQSGFSEASASKAAVRRALAGPQGEELPAPAEEEQMLPETLEREITALQSGGEPLPPPLKADMEGRFGTDFSSVRIHTDPQAAQLNDILHAHAFTAGEHIAFNQGRFQPDSGAGRFLLAHELAHVAQARGEASAVENQPLRRGFWGDLYDSAANTLGDIANWAADQVASFGWRLLETISPEFARTVRAIQAEGILPWLGRQVARAWDAYLATLRALVPFEGPRQLIDLFAGLVERAARIAAALATGDCAPLMAAIAELKTFVTDTVGVAWDRLSEFLRPVGEFFSGLWRDFGAPALTWLQEFGGEVWAGIQELGRSFWEWIRPVREAAERVWNWFRDTLFGPAEGADSTGSQGGVIGWIGRKAGEAWDWVKERTRPVWQPVADFAGQVADLIPPAFVRDMGDNAQQLSAQLDGASAGMNGGEGVPESRDTLASVLPSVGAVIGSLRRLLVGAGQWLGSRIAAVAANITGLISRLGGNALLSWLAGAFSWLSEAVATLLSWARDKVAVLFDWLVRGFDALTPFIELVLEVVRKVITLYADLLQLPLLILNGIWQRVPACIREPVENFIQQQILARIPVFGQFFSDPELWPRVQQTALGILRRIFVDGDIAGAAWAFFQSVLRILGLPPELVVQVLAKAAQAIGDILTDPLGFLGNLMRAMGAGFMGFFQNIGSHLLTGFTNWLFSTVREAGINPPADFSLRSVLGFVLEVLGVTVDNIFTRLARQLDPAIVARLRTMLDIATGVWSFVATLVNEGPAGLWRELSERLSSLWNSVVEGVVGFITERVIGWAARWLASLLDVTGIMPVVNTLIAIYRAIESFMQYLRQMLEIVSRVLDGIVSIARGAIGPAAGFVENALASALPIAIGFLANQAGLGRLSERLREILGGLRERVEAAMDWLIERALRLGRAVIDLVRRGVSAVRDWWRARSPFRSEGGEEHELHFQGSGGSAELTVASRTPRNYRSYIRGLVVPPEKAADKAEALVIADQIDRARAVAATPGPATPAAGGTGEGGAASAAPDPAVAIQTLLDNLAAKTASFMPTDAAASTPPQYGGLRNDFGTSVRVERLTSRLPSRGSGPGVSGPRWDKLRRRRWGGASFYIRGHLLNDNLGGPGNTWLNLTPLTQAANNSNSASMLHAFESDVKETVLETDGGTAINFIVTALYDGRGSRGTEIERLRDPASATSAPDETPVTDEAELERIRTRNRAVADIMEAEQLIPTDIHCQATLVEGESRRDLDVTVNNRNLGGMNTVDERPENYQI